MIYAQENNLILRDATLHDICQIKDKLRPESVQELWAADHMTAEEGLLTSYLFSEHKFVVANEEPFALCGIVPETSDTAKVWYLGGMESNKYPLSFLRLSRDFIKIALSYYPYLFNFVDARCESTKKWIEYMGGVIKEPAPYGFEQLPFHLFCFRREE